MSNFKKLAGIVVCLVLAIGAMSIVSQADGIVTLYSESGTTIQVNDWEVEAYEAVGWHSNYAEVVTILYSADGSSVTVYNSQVAEYVAVGWYTVPVTTIYTIYGDSMVVYTSDLPAYEAIGWSSDYAAVTTALYAADGSSVTVYNAQVDSYLAMGWSKTKPVVQVSSYANSDIPDFGKVTGATYKDGSTFENGSVYTYVYDSSDIYEYAEYLIANGWFYMEYDEGYYRYNKGGAYVSFGYEPDYNELWVLVVKKYSYITDTTTPTNNSLSTSKYYPGTTVPNYGYVTGRASTSYIAKENAALYSYKYYEGDFKTYGTYLQNEGWSIYDSEQEGYKVTVYFVKGSKLIGYFFDASTGDVFIVAPYN